MGNQQQNNTEKQLESYLDKEKLYGFVNVPQLSIINSPYLFN